MENDISVAALAPVRHISLKGTSSPQIVLPFTPGLEYLTDTSVIPTVLKSQRQQEEQQNSLVVKNTYA